MPGYLRKSTASQSRALGPFIDDTDFKTPKTALTIANTDVKIVVNGGASANKNSGGGTHRVNGVYGFTFDATDTATVGEFEVSIAVATALVVFDKFFVLEQAVYDLLFASGATGQVTVATNNDKTGYALSSAANNAAADALLARNIDGGSSTGRTVLQALAFLRNKWTLVGTTLTVYDVDDTSVLWTSSITTDNTAVPITASDPA